MTLKLDHAVAWEGFDVDMIPYDQSPISDDLTDADLALAQSDPLRT